MLEDIGSYTPLYIRILVPSLSSILIILFDIIVFIEFDDKTLYPDGAWVLLILFPSINELGQVLISIALS